MTKQKEKQTYDEIFSHRNKKEGSLGNIAEREMYESMQLIPLIAKERRQNRSKVNLHLST